MKYNNIKSLKAENFRRYTGIHKETFEKIIEILKAAEISRRRKGGHKSKLSVEDVLLLTLEILRKSRTYSHTAQNYGVHKTIAIRICKWVENTLIKSIEFSLPNQKVLVKSDTELELILIDATETPTERLKKRRQKNKKPIKNRKNKQKKYYSDKKKFHTYCR